MYSIYITDLAHEDFDSIISYMAIQLSAPTAATEFADAIEKCYDNLKSNPLMYQQCRDVRLKKQAYRRAVIKNYVLVYRIEEKEKRVYIYRIFYGARDYEKLI